MPFTSIHPLFLLALLAIVLIIFGPGKLPELGGAIGRSIKEFRKASNELTDEVKSAIETRNKGEEHHTPEPPKAEATQAEPPKAAQVEPPKVAQVEPPKVAPADKPDAAVEKK